jgi:hypothetical protein
VDPVCDGATVTLGGGMRRGAKSTVLSSWQTNEGIPSRTGRQGRASRGVSRFPSPNLLRARHDSIVGLDGGLEGLFEAWAPRELSAAGGMNGRRLWSTWLLRRYRVRRHPARRTSQHNRVIETQAEAHRLSICRRNAACLLPTTTPGSSNRLVAILFVPSRFIHRFENLPQPFHLCGRRILPSKRQPSSVSGRRDATVFLAWAFPRPAPRSREPDPLGGGASSARTGPPVRPGATPGGYRMTSNGDASPACGRASKHWGGPTLAGACPGQAPRTVSRARTIFGRASPTSELTSRFRETTGGMGVSSTWAAPGGSACPTPVAHL